ncbi:biotin transporter BioY [Proteinivorax hydrogeniformans]|uniref:Biotin transporter n=1 Tax=Proteinivorax hydrogeniformans TaxID=1826727 RepID=A0AAU8HVQ9_9FIRM
MTTKSKLSARDIVLTGLFVALMAIGANATSFLMVGGVPVTLQTFFSIMAGILLGSRMGVLSMTAYTVIGLAGAPIFANLQGGLNVILSPTFGFILSFISVAYVVGKFMENSSVLTQKTYLMAALLGLLTNYILGVHYMYFAYRIIVGLDAVHYSVILSWMIPAFIKDLALTVLAAIVTQRIYQVINLS